MKNYSYTEYRAEWPAATSIPTLTSGGALLGAASLRYARQERLRRIRGLFAVLNPFRKTARTQGW